MPVEVVYQTVFGELSNLSPYPLPLQGKGEKILKRGASPLLNTPFGVRIKMHKAIYNKLKEVARKRQLITYKELAAVVGLDWNKDYGKCQQIFSILRAICTAEVEQEHPMLAAIAVRRDTGMPGSGFFALAHDLGRYQSGTDYSFWTAERDAVWNFLVFTVIEEV
jgi:hypothetical protein